MNPYPVTGIFTRKQEHSWEARQAIRDREARVSVFAKEWACSEGPYLELFARGRRDGWTSWGVQADDGYRPSWKTYAFNSAAVAAEQVSCSSVPSFC